MSQQISSLRLFCLRLITRLVVLDERFNMALVVVLAYKVLVLPSKSLPVASPKELVLVLGRMNLRTKCDKKSDEQWKHYRAKKPRKRK